MVEQLKTKLILLEKNSAGEASPNLLEEQQEKILSSVCELERKNFTTQAELEELITNTEENTFYLAHVSLAEEFKSSEKFQSSAEKITLYLKQEESLIYNINSFSNFSFFCIDSASAADLVRILHQHYSRKKSTGVYTLMEKGSLILGEKIQSLQNIGSVLDQVYEYLSKANPNILNQFQNIRQLITAMTGEAIEQCSSLKMSYPTVDFQFSASKEKATFAIRFPKGSLDFNSLEKNILSGNALPWFLAWKSCDFLLIKNIANLELEVKGIIFSKNGNTAKINSILLHTTEEKSAGKTLLSAPSSYSFSLINEIKTKKPIFIKPQESAEVDVEKNKTDSQQEQIKLLSEKIKIITKELSLKKNEVIKTVKDYEAEISQIKKKNSDLENKCDYLAEKIKDASSDSMSKGDAHKIAADQKASEKEKSALLDKIQKEEKRYSALEQKYATLHKDLQEKDKEIIELKSEILKSKREAQKNEAVVAAATAATVAASTTPAAAATAAAVDKDTATKIRDLETKESVFKQEIRKLHFKLEASEKNVKALKDENAEKTKLLEKKLEAGKLKEVELLKKIEELGGLLKKVSKAA